LIDNPPRMFGARRAELAVELDTSTWSRPGVYSLITSSGVAEEEMRRTFNLGLGMLVAVGEAEAERALVALAAAGQEGARVGRVRRRTADQPAVSFAK
jgi:phosphoribosylformylglycinamidine cyclo-ligase